MDDDFYEPDEPVEQVKKAFDQGVKGVTSRPTGSAGTGTETTAPPVGGRPEPTGARRLATP